MKHLCCVVPVVVCALFAPPARAQPVPGAEIGGDDRRAQTGTSRSRIGEGLGCAPALRDARAASGGDEPSCDFILIETLADTDLRVAVAAAGTLLALENTASRPRALAIVSRALRAGPDARDEAFTALDGIEPIPLDLEGLLAGDLRSNRRDRAGPPSCSTTFPRIVSRRSSTA
jgi:hypothetical protein